MPFDPAVDGEDRRDPAGFPMDAVPEVAGHQVDGMFRRADHVLVEGREQSHRLRRDRGSESVEVIGEHPRLRPVHVDLGDLVARRADRLLSAGGGNSVPPTRELLPRDGTVGLEEPPEHLGDRFRGIQPPVVEVEPRAGVREANPLPVAGREAEHSLERTGLEHRAPALPQRVAELPRTGAPADLVGQLLPRQRAILEARARRHGSASPARAASPRSTSTSWASGDGRRCSGQPATSDSPRPSGGAACRASPRASPGSGPSRAPSSPRPDRVLRRVPRA